MIQASWYDGTLNFQYVVSNRQEVNNEYKHLIGHEDA